MSIRVGIMGLGTVGGGVVKILHAQTEKFSTLCGEPIEIVKVFSRRDNRLDELNIDKSLYTSSLDEFCQTELDIVVEVIGGDFPKDAMLSFLHKGTKVVTANKYLLATKPQEIFQEFTSQNLFYEASCLGGIPIISSLEEGLLSNTIQSVMGIFNGTCNYILSEMTQKGVEFDVVLKEAQDLGYAEADPTFDVDGIDASHKLSLLSSLAFGYYVPFEKIKSEGIRNLKPNDFSWAKQNGFSIKLISMAEKSESGQVYLGTFPMLLPNEHPLSHVNGAFNAVFVDGDSAGNLMYYGSGAGELPTASAVVSDIVAAAQQKLRQRSQTVFSNFESNFEIDQNKKFGFYTRLRTRDEAGVLAKLCNCFADADISLNFVHQLPSNSTYADIVFTTHPNNQCNLEKAIKNMQEENLLIDKPLIIRILES